MRSTLELLIGGKMLPTWSYQNWQKDYWKQV